MKFVKLLTAARVAGVLRHPHEGVLHVDDAEADRLVETKVGEDVTADFTAKQNRETPVENGAEPSGSEAAAAANPTRPRSKPTLRPPPKSPHGASPPGTRSKPTWPATSSSPVRPSP